MKGGNKQLRVHIVQKGDTMWLIAKKYGVSLDELIKANPQIPDPNKIDVGMKINLPGGGGTELEYIVQKGDTMWLIAKKYGVSLDELIMANPQIPDPNKIDVGMKINLPGGMGVGPKYIDPKYKGYQYPEFSPLPGEKSELPDHLKAITYVVKAGDTLLKIAEMFGVTLQKLIAANPQIDNPDKINIGQKIFIPSENHYEPCPMMYQCPFMKMLMHMPSMQIPCMAGHLFMHMPYYYMHAPYHAPYYMNQCFFEEDYDKKGNHHHCSSSSNS